MVTEELENREVLDRPRPAEYDQEGVARDPRRGQYRGFGLPYSRMCKEVYIVSQPEDSTGALGFHTAGCVKRYT